MDTVRGSSDRPPAVAFDEPVAIKLGWHSDHFEFGNWFAMFGGSSQASSLPGFPLMPQF